MHHLRPISLLTVAVTLISSPVMAQSESGEPSADQTATSANNIIVTGTKQKTTLQDSDVAVTVLTQEALSEARVTDIDRIDDLVPNVQFNDGNAVGGVFISIRGVESNPFIVNRAAVYIDGIPFRELSNSVLTQLESVEVLRGPQSTLYGANTESGLIVINTRSPSDELVINANATGSFFDTGEAYDIEGFIGGPIAGDQLNGSLSFQYSNADYYLQNIGATPQGQGKIEDIFVQAKLEWTPTDRLTINTLGYFIETNAPGVYTFDGFPVDLDSYNAIYSDGVLFDPTNPFAIPPVNGDLRATDFRFVHDAPKRAEVDQYVFGLSSNYALDSGEIDFAVSYRSEEKDDRGFDIDGTNGPFLAGAELSDEEVFNVEMRFTSDPTAPLRGSIGASYYWDEEVQILGSLVGPGTLQDFNFAPDQSASSSDFGVFGSLSYSPPGASDLTLTAGLRYDNARRSTTQQAGSLDLGFAVFVFDDLSLEETFDAVLPRVALRYEPSDQLTLYASAAKGYLPGGFNLTAAQDGFQDEVVRYDSEQLWSYEAGFKWQSAEGNARIAGAVFFIEADNYQEITVLQDEMGNILSTSFIASDAAIESYGFELEGQWDVTDTLKLTGNIGVTEAEYTDFGRAEAALVVGNPVKIIPQYDANIAARYAHPSGIFLRAEVNFIGETALDEGNRTGFTANAIDTQSAVEMLNLQAGYEADNWTLRLFAENLTDVRRLSGSGFPNAVFPNDGLLSGSLDRPRTIGAELSFQY